jgi:hypothetical protein
MRARWGVWRCCTLDRSILIPGATVKRFGAEAAERANQLLDEGDMAGTETWHRILNATAHI